MVGGLQLNCSADDGAVCARRSKTGRGREGRGGGGEEGRCHKSSLKQPRLYAVGCRRSLI